MYVVGAKAAYSPFLKFERWSAWTSPSELQRTMMLMRAAVFATRDFEPSTSGTVFHRPSLQLRSPRSASAVLSGTPRFLGWWPKLAAGLWVSIFSASVTRSGPQSLSLYAALGFD